MKQVSASFSPTLRTVALLVAMLVLFLAGTYVRMHFLVVRGGLEGDQIDWAMRFYFGGLSKTYLSMRDAILAGRVDPQMWPYLPGYPAFLAILDMIGMRDLRSVRMVQVVLDAAAVFPLVYVVAQLTRSAVLAVFAAGIYAVAPWWAQGAGHLLGESLVPALVISALAGMIWMRDHPQSRLGWGILGLFCTTLPFFRSELVLLVLPLMVWAVMVGLPGRRLISAATVGLAFAAPVLAWCLRNYLTYGQFALVPPVSWYALWSGLGQVANDFGFVVNDTRAFELLKSKGIIWHTPDAEVYWKQEYLHAWIEHPGHVLQTILFRMNSILSQCDYGSTPLLGMCNIVYRWFAWATLPAMLWLLWKRRWPDAFLVAGPLAFALLSLGFIYVELRYVRYAGISYLVGFPVLVALAVDYAASLSKRLDARSIKAAIGAFGVAAITIYFATQQPLLRKSEYLTLISKDADPLSRNADHPDVTIQSLAFQPAIAAVSTTSSPEGVDVQSAVRNGSYLLTAALNPGKADVVAVVYRVKLIEGDVNFGILSGDEKTFLGNQTVSGPPNSVQSSRLLSAAQPASLLVVSATNPTEQGTRFQIQDLQITFLCLEKPFELGPLYLFGRPFPRINSCNRPAPRQ
jgi:hypothetical protein